MVSSVKLLILKKGEYIIWTMKMKQYLAHTDYALCEVILNGNSTVHMTKYEAGNEVEVPPLTAQKILARTRERKAKSTLLCPFQMSIQLDSMELKMEEATDFALMAFTSYPSSSSSSNSKNVDFVSTKSTSSTNELNASYSVSTAICHSSYAQEDLKQIDQDDLEEMDLKWLVAMLSMTVKRFYKKTRRKLEFNGKEQVGFDKTKGECFNYHRRGHFARDCKTARNSGNTRRKQLTLHLWLSLQILQALQVQIPSQFNEKEVLDVKEEEVTKTVFDNCLINKENSIVNDRLKKDDSIYKFKISETVTSLTKDEKDALETSTAFVEKTKKVSTGALLIRDWETNSDNDSVFRPSHIPAKIDFVKAVFTRSGRIPVSAAKPKAISLTTAAKPVNTTGPK
nr:ribonuclease H-like domain-containing protein [Tanacetum cinerariifolium]